MTLTTLIDKNSSLTPIKTDDTGRLRLSSDHKIALLDSFEQSGMSGIQFAKLHGLKYPTFISWVRKRKDQSEISNCGPFVEVEFTQCSASNTPLCIALPNGAKIEVHSHSQVSLAADLLNKLNRQSQC